jgi:hypothetical protein
VRADVAIHLIDDEAVLYDLARDTVHFLNATSTLVLRECLRSRRENEIVRAAVEAFAGGDASIPSVEAGVRESISMFRRDGLLCGESG